MGRVVQSVLFDISDFTMQSVVRAASLGQLARVSSSAVPAGTAAIKEAQVPAAAPVVVQPPASPLTSYSMSKQLLTGSQVRLSSGLGVSSTVRCYHAGNMDVPDFTYYRRSAVKDPTAKSSETEQDRKAFSYVMAGGMGLGGAYGAKSLVNQFLSTWSASQEIEECEAVDPATLRDPEADADRVKDAEWLVILGVCTHLGCVPIANAGEFGGYYCPCHGSHYDASGRIRKGPAPLNLEVPYYEFPEEGLVVVG